jgi:hypothetical protein
MNDKNQVNTIFKMFMYVTFIVAVIAFVFMALTPLLSTNRELCVLYRNIIEYYKIIALYFLTVGLIGLYLNQQRKLSICVMVLGLINGLLSFIYYFSSACVL